MTEGAHPRSVVLGADAWAVLRAAAPALLLPAAFDAGPALAPEQADAAGRALRASAVVPGAGGDLVEDLHPSVRASLLLHLAPGVVVDTLVGLGAEVRVGRFAAAGLLASGLQRTRLGPVTLTTVPVEALAPLLAGLLPGLGDAAPTGAASTDAVPTDAPPSGAPLPGVVRLDAAVAAAVAQAVGEGRTDLAAGLLDGPVPRALGPLSATALLVVGGAGARRGLLCLRTPHGWRSARLSEDDLELRPLSRAGLVTDLAAALGGALAAAAA